MPAILGGRIDWCFGGVEPMEAAYHGLEEGPTDKPFWYSPITRNTCVRLLFKPNERAERSLEGFEFGHIGVDSEYTKAGEFPAALILFRKLTDITLNKVIHFYMTPEGVLVEVPVEGRIRNPEGLMRGIVRWLSGQSNDLSRQDWEK